MIQTPRSLLIGGTGLDVFFRSLPLWNTALFKWVRMVLVHLCGQSLNANYEFSVDLREQRVSFVERQNGRVVGRLKDVNKTASMILSLGFT